MSELIALPIIGALGVGGVLALRAAWSAAEATGRRAVHLTYPRGTSPEQMVAFMRSLGGLLPPRWQRLIARPAVVIETVSDHAGISHRLRLPAGSAEYVLAQLRAAVPGARIEKADDSDWALPTLALELETTSATQALRTDDPAQSAAGLLATLQPLRDGDTAVVQWVVSPAPPVRVPELVTLNDPRRGWLGWLTAQRQPPARIPAELAASATSGPSRSASPSSGSAFGRVIPTGTATWCAGSLVPSIWRRHLRRAFAADGCRQVWLLLGSGAGRCR